MELYVRNVNEALALGISLIKTNGCPRNSRNGPVLECTEPVITHYEAPWERVLLSPIRAANPFLHLFESLWMLAGRNDLKFLKQIVSRFEDYSDDGVILQGAYGARWRHRFKFDQIEVICQLLQNDKDTRRAVLTMWDPYRDLLAQHSKDLPCNTHIYFKVRRNKLDMTVCCRSNDLLWGAFGANAVHFSILQEYIAKKVGLNIGRMTQISDSLHVYVEGPGGELWKKVSTVPVQQHYYPESLPLFYDYQESLLWDEDLRAWFTSWETQTQFSPNTQFFADVVSPMWSVWITRNLELAYRIKSLDWRKACIDWLERRLK